MSTLYPDGSPSDPSPGDSSQTERSLLDSALQDMGQGDKISLPPIPDSAPEKKQSRRGGWIPIVGWVLALTLVALALFTYRTRPRLVQAQQPQQVLQPTATARPLPPSTAAPDNVPVTLPPFVNIEEDLISREIELKTIIPTRPRTDVFTHTVTLGDSVFGLADTYNLTPESVLWANYTALNDNPDQLSTGMVLNIPPTNGVLYRWEEGDTLESIAAEFKVVIDNILNFTGNQLDLADPIIEPGKLVMVPEGEREFRQWLIPTINRGNAGVNSAALGPGACTGSYDGAYGSGAFQWPTGRHFLSGNDFWSGHLAIDIAAVEGDPILASDAGVVVFSGWANGGYGYAVVVDHGNGYQSLYAHMSQVSQPCGASVGAGSYLGGAGSTGNSTGTHLHFEIRYLGGFINPWFVLPPP